MTKLYGMLAYACGSIAIATLALGIMVGSGSQADATIGEPPPEPHCSTCTGCPQRTILRCAAWTCNGAWSNCSNCMCTLTGNDPITIDELCECIR